MALRDLTHIIASHFSQPYSRLFVVSDGADWVLRYEGEKIVETVKNLGIAVRLIDPPRFGSPQCFHFTSQFALINPRLQRISRRMSVDFYHGSSQSHPHFATSLAFVKTFSGDVLRIRVSNRRVHEWLLSEGVPAGRIRRIPIGIDTDVFRPRSLSERTVVRQRLDIPDDAFVVGSFQKDGVGWGEGLEPKLIKGPDILVQTLTLTKKDIPNLFAFLSGPARGYVKRGLEAAGIPYRHVLLDSPEAVAPLYHALDAYLITARDEGGPKGFLESLASGVPCVATRVGQIEDLAEHGRTALLADIDDSDTLAENIFTLARMPETARTWLTLNGLALARRHTYTAQHPLWDDFFTDYVIR